MRRTRIVLPALAGLFLLLLAACGDTSSNVGIDLVEEGGEPVVRQVAPSRFASLPFNDITGAKPRVLAGRVADPLMGTVTTSGYIDFTSTFDATDTSPLVSATLRLTPDYVYGDTLAPVTLNLHDLTDDWNAAGTKADTTLPVGALVTTFTFQPTDTLVTVSLPESWIAANDTTLRSSRFATSFHGFALEAVTSEAVVGVDFTDSDLRVITEADTFAFDLTRTLTGIRRDGEPAVPDGYILLQDGVGPNVILDFEFEGLDTTPLHGAILRFFADTVAVQTTAPPNFVRPLVETLQLIRVTEADEAFFVGEATLTEEGDYRFSDPLLSNVLQQTFFGVDLFDHLELRVPTDDNTINFMLLYDAEAGAMAPEAFLTISP